MKLPQRIKVKSILHSRYLPEMQTDLSGLSRPASWDSRFSGRELVLTEDNQEIPLLSNGAQSTPKAGWVLLLTSGDINKGFHWTLYGISKNINS